MNYHLLTIVTFFSCFYNYNYSYKEVKKLLVKVFDESHEKDLEKTVNAFLSELTGDIVDIKFQVAIGISGEEQIYCFSAMICYYD